MDNLLAETFSDGMKNMISSFICVSHNKHLLTTLQIEFSEKLEVQPYPNI